MKVFCVNNSHHINCFCPKTVVGNYYTVSEERRFDDGMYYQLAEYPPKHVDGRWHYYYYHSKGFAILPDQDADAMQEAEKEGIVNLEKAVV
jgi:hypothetical protein